MRGFLVALLIPAAVSGPLLAEDGGGVLLKYAYPPGKQAVYKHKDRVQMNLGGTTAEMISEYKTTERLARAEESGSFGVAVVLSDISESTLVSSHLIQREVMALLAGDEFGFSLSPNGTVSDFWPPSMKKVYAGDRDAMQATITNLEVGYASLFPELPDRPVGVGDSWSSEREYRVTYDVLGGIEGSVLLSSTHRVKKAKRKDGSRCFEIEDVTQIASRGYLNFGEISVVSEGSGTIKGKWLFDYETGLVRKHETKAKISAQSIPVGVEDAEPLESHYTAWSKRELVAIE